MLHLGSDGASFLAAVRGASFAGEPMFNPETPVTVARAPGRLDVMGGFGDYSGSLVLELPIAEAAFVAVQKSNANRVRFTSVSPHSGVHRNFELSLAEVRRNARSFRDARQCFSVAGSEWAGYVGGAIAALAEDYGTYLESGLNLFLWSRVPEGKGVSSSAAIEVASLYALAGLHGVSLNPVEAALSCQRVENLVVGAACGVMDQVSASCGAEGHILPLLCQPAQLQPSFPIARGLKLWGIDSGIKHQIGGSSYTQVRVATFMGYRILAGHLGLPAQLLSPGRVQLEDAVMDGYLANLRVEDFGRLSSVLPLEMNGRDFLREYGGITDCVTSVDPDALYRVRAAASHPVLENHRAALFRELMQDDVGREEAECLGGLMRAAHASYAACGLGSTGTDRLVALVAEEGPDHGLFGAKITGGGSGGSVAILGLDTAEDAIQRVAQHYAEETGHEPYVFAGSSPGAAAFGVHPCHFRDGQWRPGSDRSPTPTGCGATTGPG